MRNLIKLFVEYIPVPPRIRIIEEYIPLYGKCIGYLVDETKPGPDVGDVYTSKSLRQGGRKKIGRGPVRVRGKNRPKIGEKSRNKVFFALFQA